MIFGATCTRLLLFSFIGLLIINGCASSSSDTSTNTNPTQPDESELSGVVDNDLISGSGMNVVYVYKGNTTPDDIGSPTEPVATATVSQDNTTLLWQYSFTTLDPGEYTIAFTNDAANDNTTTDDNISFMNSAFIEIILGQQTKHDFNSFNTINVGPGRQYTLPSQVSDIANDGDVIEIDAGVYLDDIVVWRQNNLTLRGVGGRAHLKSTKMIPYTPSNDQENGMGIWVLTGSDVRVENIEFSGAKVPDWNGAGIRANGSNLTVVNCYFHDNENGILGGGGNVLIEYSEFAYNGRGDGQSHNLYISGDKLTFRYNYSHHAKIGHNLKTRAVENYILYNRIMDEADGTASYAIDIPDAGLSYVIGNLIQQGPDNDNSTILSYAAESLSNGSNILRVVNNTFVNDNNGSGTFLGIPASTTTLIANNIFARGGNAPTAGATVFNNLVTASPGFIDIDNYDYRLAAGSAAIGQGENILPINGYDVMPKYQYVHKVQRELRPANATIDIGAYEYTN